MAIKENFPKPGVKIKTKTGNGTLKSIDPIKGIATIVYKNEQEENVTLEQLQALIGDKKSIIPKIKKKEKDAKGAKGKND